MIVCVCMFMISAINFSAYYQLKVHASDLGKIPFTMQPAVSQPILVEDR